MTDENEGRVSSASGHEDGPIEVDNGISDADSTIDDQLSQYTATLTSSVLSYPMEHGRRYHAYRSGCESSKIISPSILPLLRFGSHAFGKLIRATAYFAPNDESENDRLDFTHALIRKTLNGELYLAPLETEKVHRILDIGTGTGIWAIEMGDLFEHAEIVGNDLSAIQPEWVPPNVKFEIDDVESPWIYPATFDFIFSRYLAGSIGDWPKLMGNVYDNLSSGGWAEFQDYDFLFKSDDETLKEEHHTWQWNHQFIDATVSIGRESRPGPKLEAWVRDAGFKNIRHFVHKWPIGPWAKDPYFKDIGMCNLVQLLEGLEAFTLRVFCGVLKWPEEKVLVLLAKVRAELKAGTFHAYGTFHVVYGQKP